MLTGLYIAPSLCMCSNLLLLYIAVSEWIFYITLILIIGCVDIYLCMRFSTPRQISSQSAVLMSKELSSLHGIELCLEKRLSTIYIIYSYLMLANQYLLVIYFGNSIARSLQKKCPLFFYESISSSTKHTWTLGVAAGKESG